MFHVLLPSDSPLPLIEITHEAMERARERERPFSQTG